MMIATRALGEALLVNQGKTGNGSPDATAEGDLFL
jgi:hypothetical protein